MHRLLLLIKDRDRKAYLQQLEAARLPDLEIVESSNSNVDLVFGEPALVRENLPNISGLKWVQSTWAGVEPLLETGLRRDYILTNARGVFGGLVSEYVIGYLLLEERKILQRLDAQKHSRWDASLTGTLRGKTIGLLGVGSIGAYLAETASYFGMLVRGYTRSSETSPHVNKYYHGEGLTAFADGLDVLVNTLPNTPATRKIINARLLAALPPHARFINVGRGNAVDDAALIEALSTDRLAGAVLDVFEYEPLPSEHPFWHTKNMIITSHTAAPSFPDEISKVFIENYLLYLSGQPLKYRVNFELGY